MADTDQPFRDAELGFMKKPPKGDPRDPKRLKKDLPKFMKTLAPGDRIMFVGKSFNTTSGFTSGYVGMLIFKFRMF